ncbi:unnamed protein product, partial [Prorocentrum cordatum]
PCRNVPGRLRRSLGEGLGDGSESGGASEPSQEAPAFSLPPPGSPPNQGWATSAPQPAPAPEGIPRLPSRRLPTGAALRYARSSSPSRRVEKAITKNPAPSAATTKSARAAAPRRGWAAKTGSHRGRGLRGCAEGPRAPQRSGQLSRAAPTHRASLDPLRAPLRRGTARWEEYVPLYCGQFPTAAYMRSTGCWNREQSHCSRRDAAPASRTAMLTLPNDNSRIARAAPGWLRHGAEVGRGRVNDFRRGGGGGEGRRSIDLRSRGHGAPRFRVASRRGHGGPNPPLPRLALLGFGGGGRGCLETRSVVRVASPWVEGT